jgi:Cu(I)/Ag(I) efflux system membrane protein CusA/SilA
MQRIAVPMIGGMVSSTILTLVVIPAIYGLIKGWPLRAKTAQVPEEKAEAMPLPEAAE